MKLFRAPRLFKILLVILSLLAAARMLAVRGVAGDAEALAAALTVMRAGDHATALALAGPSGSVTSDLIEWHRLRETDAGFDDYRAFLARRPDWPGLPLLMRRGEASILPGTDPDVVLAYFADQPAQSGHGAVRAIEAHLAKGQAAEAEALAIRAWRTMTLGPPEESALLARYSGVLAGHHEARLDMLLWAGVEDQALRMLPLVGPDWQALAAARLGLRANRDGVDALVAAVPAALDGDPGLAFERFQWRRRNDRPDAVDLMESLGGSPDRLGRPEAWAEARRSLARGLMRQGHPARAYALASRHGLTEGGDYADLEWLAGYLALTYLDDPAAALDHFVRLRQAVDTPISLGRAGYWEGRALEALGRPVDAQAAYEFGGEFQTAFYGLLAAEKAGLPMDPALLGAEVVPDWRTAPFLQSSVAEATQLLIAAGDRILAKRFLRHLGESLEPVELAQAAEMAMDLGEPHVALSMAKFAADLGIVLNRPYYPVTGLAAADLPVPAELALSIARRESEFDPEAVSHAGARGLMQLMPATAEAMAAKLGLTPDLGRLTSDPDFNLRLGAAYLAQLREEFGTNPILVAAGYNAGPSRARAWIAERGDPRRADVDVIDWIEHIPFEETRNYVMRVSESLPVYRARLAGTLLPLRFLEEIEGS